MVSFVEAIGPRRLTNHVPMPVMKTAYRIQQASLRYPLVALQQAVRRLANQMNPATDEQARLVRNRYVELLHQDVANVEAGHYPAELLFQFPMREYARSMPKLIRDLPKVFRRQRKRDWRELPNDVELGRYPAYYRRTFHWQSDGYLSRKSAELYDVGVELVFTGSADVMRRQVIPPIAEFIGRPAKPARVIDVACGTGRTLRQLAQAVPHADYYGLDLSPYYLQVARQVLGDIPNVSLVAENGETMPFKAGHFDVVPSTYLFHELPKNARQRVLREMLRVLRPGGLLVIEVSIQSSDSPEIAFAMERFPEDLHEPFYRDYMRHDLAGLIAEAGFDVVRETPAFMAKVITARRPEPTQISS